MTPPTTKAPSPPIMTKPSRAGKAVHKAVSINGAARSSVLRQENPVAKPPRYIE
ncbi:MAG: hypothetical protein ACREDG_05755 [Methylocella sp.]